jgi:hypothetical protein
MSALTLARLNSVSASRPAAEIGYSLLDTVDATRRGQMTLNVYDAAGMREGIRIESTGSAAQVSIGGGTLMTSILSATATLDFGSIGSNGTETLTMTVTGAVAGDSVFLGVPAGLDAGLIFCASVTAANTVTVSMHNSSGGSVDPASGTFRATVIRF